MSDGFMLRWYSCLFCNFIVLSMWIFGVNRFSNTTKITYTFSSRTIHYKAGVATLNHD